MMQRLHTARASCHLPGADLTPIGDGAQDLPRVGSSPVRFSSESRSESRGLCSRAIVAARVDPASRVVVASSAGVHVAGIPAAAGHRKVLRTFSAAALRGRASHRCT